MPVFFNITILILSLVMGFGVGNGAEAAIRCQDEVALETDSPLDALLAETSPRQRAFFHHALMPVLMEGRRLDLVRIEFGKRADNVTVRTPKGTHFYSFTDIPEEASPQFGMPQVEVGPTRVSSRVRFFWPMKAGVLGFDLERIRGLLRSSFRADPHAYCQLRPFPEWNEGRAVLSDPQVKAVEGLLGMEDRVPGKAGLKRALVMPPGNGKTLISAHYVRALHRTLSQAKKMGWKKKPKILFAVESTNILNEATDTFRTELGLKHIARIYGPETRAAIGPDVEMIGITRSGYFSRREEIRRLLSQDKDQPWVVVFDEGHEYMKVRSVVLQEAQFHTIRNELEEVLDHRHRVLLLSATLWHRDKPLIKDYLAGNVYGGFLTDEEQELLRAGDILDLQVLCRTAWYRAIQQGYSPPLNDLHIVTNLDGVPMSEILDASDILYQVRQRRVVVHEALLKDVARRIKRVQIPNVPDRAVLFVPSIAHANAYAPILKRLLKRDVRVYHGGEQSDPDAYLWFNDQGRYHTASDRGTHKYILVVKMLHQGANTQSANLVALLRPYGYSPAGFRALIQNAGRAGRAFERKPYFRLLDWTGFSRVLVEGIESIVVEPFRPATDGPRGEPMVVVNEEELSPLQFRGRYHDLFNENQPYAVLYPFFDLPVFQAGALRRLHEEAYHYGVSRFGPGMGARDVILQIARKVAERFPCPEIDDLVFRLETEWEWRAADGTDAKVARVAEHQSVRRIYEAIFELAVIVNSFPEGENLNVEQMHTEAGFVQFLDIVDPDRVRSLLNLEDKLLVIDRAEGSWGVLYDECRARGLGTFSDHWAAKKLMEDLVTSIPDEFAAEREALRKRMEDPNDLGLKKTDSGLATYNQYRNQLNGEQNRARNRESFQRIYRVLYAIARILEKHPSAQGLSAAHIHEREQTELLFSVLRPSRVNISLDESALGTFLDRTEGGIAILLERTASFGVQSFAREAPELLLRIAQTIPVAEIDETARQEKEELLANLRAENIWGWSSKTGSRVLEGLPNHTRAYFRALCRIAAFYNKVGTALVDPRRLHLATEMERFLDLVQLGISFPFYTRRLEASFRDNVEGGLGVLASRARSDFGITMYQTRFGPKNLFLELLNRLPIAQDTPHSRIVEGLSSDEIWGWTASDASMAKSGVTMGSSKRIFRGLYATAYLLKAHHARVNALSKMNEAAQVQRLLDAFLRF